MREEEGEERGGGEREEKGRGGGGEEWRGRGRIGVDFVYNVNLCLKSTF